MPPKKQPAKKKDAEEELVGYDISVMTLDQLKQHARLLEGEIEDLRKHCSFYQKVEDELVELLRITDEDLKYNEDSILSKDVELERLKLKFLKHLREKKQWPTFMENTSSVKKDKLSAETSSHLEKEQNRHVQETNRLKKILQEKDRQLEVLRVKIEMARRETKERNERYLKNIDEHQESLLEQTITRFVTSMEESRESFKQANEVMKYEALEEKIAGERAFNETCVALKKKLHNYYKEMTKRDLDTIKKLKEEIKNIEESIENKKKLLQEAVEENKLLKELTQSRVRKHISGNIAAKFDVTPVEILDALKTHDQTEKISQDNQHLEEQIAQVVNQTFNLRRQFTLALKRVRESAEMKATFLEKKLNAILDMKQNKPTASSTSGENESSGLNASETESSLSSTSEIR